MELEPVDILIGARPSDELAGRWASRLRTMGVTVAEGCDLTDCRGLLFSLTPADIEDGERLELLRQARANNLPVVVVKSPDLELPEADRRLLDGAKVITAQRHASVEVWLQVLHGLHALKAIASDPDDDLSTTEVSNEFRKVPESRPEWRVAAMATLVVALACLAWWVFLKRSQQEDLRGQLGQPLLPAQPAPTPKAVPIAPPAPSPASSVATATPASLALQAEQAEQAEQAMALVQACVLASNRDEGFTSDQIEHIVSFFTDPVYIVGKGEHSHASLKASLMVRQDEWPEWHENIGFIKVDDEPLAEPATLVVVVRSSFFAENPKRQDSTSGAVVTRYTVKFAPGQKPLISRIDAAVLP
jgi:hypothetical protein